MKKKILRVLTALLAAVMLCGLAGCSDSGIRDARDGIVRIVALHVDGVLQGEDAYYSLGSGFGVGEAGKPTEIFVTNRHVVYGEYLDVPAVNIYILKNDSAYNEITGLDLSQCIPCEIVYPTASDGEYPDIAILRAAEAPSGRTALRLKDDEDALKELDSVAALGFPGSSDVTEQHFWGSTWLGSTGQVTITDGKISVFRSGATIGNTRLIQHTAQINHGNSGGPLVDEKGVVIGVNTYIAGMDSSTGDSSSFYAIRVGYVKDILDDLHISYDTDAGSAFLLWAAIVIVFVVLLLTAVLLLLRRKNSAAAPAAGSTAAPREYRLQFISGAFAGRRFSVNGQVRVGTDPSRCDLVFPGSVRGISHAHCVVTQTGDALTVTDTGSSYGTFLNGRRLTPDQPTPLAIGDRVSLGSDKEMFQITGRGGSLT